MAAPKANDVADILSYGEVSVDGGTLPIWMAGEGAPVILLHGWTLDHRMWTPQIAGLAPDHFLVMPDRRGCGRASAPSDLMREADDVIAIADFLGFDRFALVGLSRGFSQAFSPVFQFLRMISPLSWMPIAVMAFGIGDAPIYFLLGVLIFVHLQ